MLSRPLLGVSSWIFGDLPLAEIAPRLQALNVDGIALHAPSGSVTPENARALLAQHELELFAVTPPNVDLAHPDPATRRAALDAYIDLLDFARAAGAPLVQCQSGAGRVRPLTTMAEEMTLLEDALAELAERAAQKQLRLALAPLNRYETHLINTAADALRLLEKVQANNLGIMLSAFHMNIEEQDAAGVIRRTGDRLFLYTMSDSNRQAIGRGHIKLGDHLWALEDINYAGPILFDCMAPGPDPFTPIKDAHSITWVEEFLQQSRSWF